MKEWRRFFWSPCKSTTKQTQASLSLGIAPTRRQLSRHGNTASRLTPDTRTGPGSPPPLYHACLMAKFENIFDLFLNSQETEEWEERKSVWRWDGSNKGEGRTRRKKGEWLTEQLCWDNRWINICITGGESQPDWVMSDNYFCLTFDKHCCRYQPHTGIHAKKATTLYKALC